MASPFGSCEKLKGTLIIGTLDLSKSSRYTSESWYLSNLDVQNHNVQVSPHRYITVVQIYLL